MKLIKENKKLFITLGIILTTILGILIFLVVYVTKPKEDIFENNYSKVVEVKATSENYGISYGTGSIINDDLSIITNSHVISYTRTNEYLIFEKIEIRFTYKDYYEECYLVKNDKDKDLALLKLKSIEENQNINYFNLKERSFKPGDTVYAFGNSSNNGISMTKGIITMPAFNLTYNNITRNVIQVDINISSGNSGGPLINEKGHLIGIITFKLRDDNNQIIEGFAYALTYNEISSFLS